MKKVILLLIAMLSSILYAGGDIRPAEASVEPAIRASSGDALGLLSVLTLIVLTAVIGMFFVKKESAV